jgi:hypothetical protein
LHTWMGRRRVDMRALLGSRAFDVRYASNSAAKADIAKGPSRPNRVRTQQKLVGHLVRLLAISARLVIRGGRVYAGILTACP